MPAWAREGRHGACCWLPGQPATGASPGPCLRERDPLLCAPPCHSHPWPPLDWVAGVLGENVKVARSKSAVTVTSEIAMSKRYLKYLTRKYLKKHNVRDFMRVVASNDDRAVYELRYFKVSTGDEEEDDE